MKRDIFEQDHNIFCDSFRQFCQKEIPPLSSEPNRASSTATHGKKPAKTAF